MSEDVATILGEFNEDYGWFLRGREGLLCKYVNRWVAIREKTILDFDDDLTALLERLRAKGLKPEELLIEFLSREPMEAML